MVHHNKWCDETYESYFVGSYARSMLSVVGIEYKFWAEVVNMACLIVNYSSTTTLNSQILEEIWPEKSLNYSIFRVFGCNTCV